MSHSAAVYMVRVRQKRDTSGTFQLLGDIDDQGMSLSAVLQNYFDGFESISDDGTKVVRSVQCDVVKDDIQCRIRVGGELYAPPQVRSRLFQAVRPQ
jgi:hypothetical protein